MAIKGEAIVSTGQGPEKIGEDLTKLCMDQWKFSNTRWVIVDGQHLNKGHKFPKIDALWEGPFEIQEVMGPVTYKLHLPPQWKIHNVFHGKTLTPYCETEVHGKNFPEPPPDLINGEEEFEVDSI